MYEEVEITGMRELRQALLSQVPRDLQRKVWPKVIRAGARVFTKGARRRCPRGRGFMEARKKGGLRKRHLYQTIRATTPRYRNGAWATTVHAGKGRPIAHLVEFGSAPHVILPSKHRTAKSRALGRRLALPGGRWTGHVNHPGTRAQPFMRPTLDEDSNAAVAAMALAGRREIDRLRYGK